MARNSKPTQEFVPVKEIRDGIAILKDGSYRAIIMASSVNFALKSDDERSSILFQFQNFLDSLDFSVQIVVQSRRLDIRPYIALLEEREKKQVNDLLKIQTREYIGFVKKFTESVNIMTKSFFVVVPYAPPAIGGQGSKLGGLFGKKKQNNKEDYSFEESVSQLNQRISVVEQGLVRTGIRIAHLGTEELTELFYKLFNPGETEKPIKLK
tara:strand:+ start:175 stop:804 length:630 start_codon:yes stop_codon:yes gene_type:complete